VEPNREIIDGNEAAASVAYRASEIIAIYPITPASPMAEHADEWSAKGRPNLWGTVPRVVEMQSEAGAAGTVHGALQAGALATTFTASQGLLLMIPDLYKIAGELTSFCMHVAARSVATHALSIFGDHSDVMACRQTGFAMLASGSVQEAHDLAAIAHAATLRSRIPFLHFFDGFRTSHELGRVEVLADDALRALLDERSIREHRARALTPDRPVLRGTAQNPDVFFQCREAANPFYDLCPSIVRQEMERFAALTGRRYSLFDYAGHPAAERVLVLMGSGGGVAEETVEWLAARGERVGVVKVRLYRPFSGADLVAALPPTTERIAVLDRTKEPGAPAEPLHLDVLAALRDGEREPLVVGGRYGLASKDFTPAMVKAVLDELGRVGPRNHFTVGIVDDVTHRSLPVEEDFDIEPGDVVRALFFGLGSDGTVGASKNTIRILSEHTGLHAQGYFVHDSKKSGALTTAHLRFAPHPLRASHLVRRAGFLACNEPGFLERHAVLDHADTGAVVLLNTPHPPERVWEHLPHGARRQILDKGLRVHAIDAHAIAREAGLGRHIGTIMQAAFLDLSGIVPRDEALAALEQATRATYGRQGEEVVERNLAALRRAPDAVHRVEPRPVGVEAPAAATVGAGAPDFVRRVTAMLLAGRGDRLPVSAFPPDGTWPVGTAKWEKRAIAREIPVWDTELCIQCNKCALMCPHAAIRAKVCEPAELEDAPDGFKATAYRGTDFAGWSYTLQVAPEDCTGCGLCIEVCPAKDKAEPTRRAIEMRPLPPLLAAERKNWTFFLRLPQPDRERVRIDNKGSQLLEPLFECGETPYVKLLTQLFGDRLLIANATGCSSIFGGNLPTTPYTVDCAGRGPAWSNSLFEDNAEFGLGLRLGVDVQRGQAERLLRGLAPALGEEAVRGLLDAAQETEAEILAQRSRVVELRLRLAGVDAPEARELERLADQLVRKSVWLVGGDGWAYDIGYGGLEHVLAGGQDVNVLVLDTEVYSNTGGQQSKATPLGAVAKFAASGKERAKKDLGLAAMSLGNVYVATVALGARDNQAIKAFVEAESYRGPSLIIAYSPCIAHGYDLAHGAEHQRLAVDSGAWPLYRFDPRRRERGEPALRMDSGPPRVPIETYMRTEARFRGIERGDPERFHRLTEAARLLAAERHALHERLANPAGGSKEGTK
jgi:pyruvate-ferredoxin/flavodoxin oxidoreductase